VFGGCAQDKSFDAVFCVGAAFVGFVMDQCFHANGDVHRHVRTLIGLDALWIEEVGGAAVQPAGEVDTIDGLAWRGLNR
jgi:hypothetical protein